MIDFKSTLKIALKSLEVNKMRSALTSLGIIIGVGAVIIMLALGSGANKQVQSNIESMGSNVLTIRSASAKTGGVSMGMGSKPTLSVKDAEAIQKNARGIDAVAPIMSSSKQAMYGNQNWQTTVYGITTPYLYVKSYDIKEGRTFTKNGDLVASISEPGQYGFRYARVEPKIAGDDVKRYAIRGGEIQFTYLNNPDETVANGTAAFLKNYLKAVKENRFTTHNAGRQ